MQCLEVERIGEGAAMATAWRKAGGPRSSLVPGPGVKHHEWALGQRAMLLIEARGDRPWCVSGKNREVGLLPVSAAAELATGLFRSCLYSDQLFLMNS